MIVAILLQTGRRKKYKDIEAAYKELKCITLRRLLWCLNTGHRWKGLVFDEIEEEQKSAH